THLHALQEIPGLKGRRLKFICARLVDCVGSFFREQFVNIKIALKFQYGPMEERITYRIRDGVRPFAKLIDRAAVSGDVFLRNTQRAHSPPFVVVASEPYCSEVLEARILSDVAGREVAMVINYGLLA